MGKNQFSYTLHPGKTIDGAEEVACRYLNYSNMEIQTFNQSEYRIIQARVRKGGLKQFVGMDKAIEIRLYQSGNQLMVEIGQAKWADKAAVMAVSMFVLWPLTVTSGIGIYQQNKLIKKIRETIEQYIYG